MRSLATRDAGSEISAALGDAIAACKVAGFDLIVVETSGIGQGDAAIVPLVDVSLYVMTPEYGAASQLEKIDMLDFADFVAINKFDRQRRRGRAARRAQADTSATASSSRSPPRRCRSSARIATRFNDDGVTALYQAIAPKLAAHGFKPAAGALPAIAARASTGKSAIVPPARSRYLAEIADAVRGYKKHASDQSRLARERQQVAATKSMLGSGPAASALDPLIAARDAALDARSKKLLEMWPAMQKAYSGDEYVVKIRDREVRTKLTYKTPLGHDGAARSALPRYEDHGEILRWLMLENVPGSFPYTGGRVRVQARERGPDADVRRRGRSVPHQPPLPPALEGHAGEAALDGVRLGDAVRLRPARASGHLRQGRQFRRLDRDARRHEGALRRASTSATRRPRCR